MKTKIIILTITILALTSCRKYDEGGFYVLSNMSKKIAGGYNFTHYYIDGVDSADYYFNNEYSVDFVLGYNQQSDIRTLSMKYNHFSNDHDKYFLFQGSWNWNNKNKKEIKLKFYDKIESGSLNNPLDTTINNGPFSPSVEHVWNILKFKKGDLILETNFNNKHYRAELKEYD